MESNWMHHYQEFQKRDQELQIFTLSFGLSLKLWRSGTGKPWNETAFMSKYLIICDRQWYLHQSPTSLDFTLADFFKVQHRKREGLILAASVFAFCYSGGKKKKDERSFSFLSLLFCHFATTPDFLLLPHSPLPRLFQLLFSWNCPRSHLSRKVEHVFPANRPPEQTKDVGKSFLSMTLPGCTASLRPCRRITFPFCY